MRVLLMDPPHHALKRSNTCMQVHPLGLGYVSAALSADHDVIQLIPDVRPFGPEEDPWQAIEQCVQDFAPDVVGLTSVTATFPAATDCARLVKRVRGSECKVVLGGVHATFQPQQALDVPEVDVVVLGEGDLCMPELLAAIETGRSLADVSGLALRGSDGKVKTTAARPVLRDLDMLPHPDRSNIHWSEHLLPSFYQAMITVRGCPYTCIYCSVPRSSQRRTRYRSAKHIQSEIRALKRGWDIPYLFFHDSVFTLNRRRTIDLMQRLQEEGPIVPYACQTRTDRVDAELLDAMAAGGCHQVFFGIESGHPESLARINKAVPLDDIRAAVAQVKARGIRCTGFFMVGFPWEGEEHIRRTGDFAQDLGLDAISLFSATPLPGTSLWDTNHIALPASIDFRAPQVNLTSLPDAEYRALFARIADEVCQYNRGQMGQAAQSWLSTS